MCSWKLPFTNQDGTRTWEASRRSRLGYYADERSQVTAWPWRDVSPTATEIAAESPFNLDYASFTVIVNATAAVADPNVVWNAVKAANEDYARLRANLDQALSKLLYSCDPGTDDAFTHLMDVVSCVVPQQ